MGKLQLAASEAHDRIIKERGEITFIDAFVGGYDYAKEELALTWEDVRVLDEILARVEEVNMVAEMRGEEVPFNSDEAFYGEALKRFNEAKEKK